MVSFYGGGVTLSRFASTSYRKMFSDDLTRVSNTNETKKKTLSPEYK